jgi:predicted secreted protein with PEFG-CTERM motif
MIGGLGTDKDFRQIRDIDISKVRAIYGSGGFYAFSTTPIPQPTTPIPQPTTPIPQPILHITPIFPFENIGISSDEIIVDRHSTQYVKVFGKISENVLLKGHPIFLKITYPDLTEELLRITVGSRSGGQFETTISFDHYDLLGSYIISATYLEHTDKSMDVKFKIISKDTHSKSNSQIINQQPSSLTNDDYDGDGVIDNIDSCPYDTETFNGYQDNDGCPDKLPDKLPNPIQTLNVDSLNVGLSITANAIEGSDTFEIIGSTTDINNVVTLVVKSPTGNLINVDQRSPDTNGNFILDVAVEGGLWFQDGAYTVTAQQGSGSMFIDSVEVEIADGVVVPEFGTIAAMILAVAIISIIAISSKSRLSIVPRY